MGKLRPIYQSLATCPPCLLAALIAFLAPQLGHSAGDDSKRWTLDQVVKRVLEVSPALKAAQKEVLAAEAQARQSGRWDNPEASLSTGSKQVSILKGSAFEGTLKQAIPLFGQKGIAKEVGLQQAKIAESDAAIQALDLRHEAVERAYQYAAVTEQMKHIAHRREKIGLIAQFLRTRPFASPSQAVEKSLIENRIREIEEQFQKVSSTRKKRWESLNELLWVSQPVELDLPWVIDPVLPSQQGHLEKVAHSNPVTERQKKVVASSELAINQAGKKKFPDIRIGGGYSEENVDLREKSTFGFIEFSIPLWDMGGNAVSAAEAKREAEELRLEQKRREVQSEFNRTWADLEEARNRIKIFPLSLTPKLEAEMQRAESNWKKGLVPATAFLELESQVHDQAVKAFDAQLDYVEALSKLLALAGEEFHQAEVE